MTAKRLGEAEAKKAAEEGAAFDKRFKDQTAASGSEAAVRRMIEEVRTGKPNYDLMSPGLADATRQQLPQMQSDFSGKGALQSVIFKGVGPGGADIYQVNFDKASIDYRIWLNADGKVDSSNFRPSEYPVPIVATAESLHPKLMAIDSMITADLARRPIGSVTAGVPTTAIPSLLAHLVAPSTIYAVEFPGGAPAGETYQWIGAIGCGTFSPFSKTPTALRSGGSTATWTHPNAPLPPPDLSRSDADGDGVFDFCPHSEVPNFSHPGKITVIMTDGRGGDAYCTYDGSLEGTGQCHLGKP